MGFENRSLNITAESITVFFGGRSDQRCPDQQSGVQLYQWTIVVLSFACRSLKYDMKVSLIVKHKNVSSRFLQARFGWVSLEESIRDRFHWISYTMGVVRVYTSLKCFI